MGSQEYYEEKIDVLKAIEDSQAQISGQARKGFGLRCRS